MRDDFEAKNRQLLDEMPRFYGSRLSYFQPSFEIYPRGAKNDAVYCCCLRMATLRTSRRRPF